MSKFCTLVPNTYLWSSVWTLLRVTIPAPGIFRWLLDFLFFLALIAFVNWDDIFFYIFHVVLTLPMVREKATKSGTNLTGFCEHWFHKIRDFIDLTMQQVHFVVFDLWAKFYPLFCMVVELILTFSLKNRNSGSEDLHRCSDSLLRGKYGV